MLSSVNFLCWNTPLSSFLAVKATDLLLIVKNAKYYAFQQKFSINFVYILNNVYIPSNLNLTLCVSFSNFIPNCRLNRKKSQKINTAVDFMGF